MFEPHEEISSVVVITFLLISGESEVFFDNIIVQLAKLAKVNINTTQDLIPALFLKSFTDSTGCQIGVTSAGSVGPNKIHIALRNLTDAFTVSCDGLYMMT